jgi:hypothetical protein
LVGAARKEEKVAGVEGAVVPTAEVALDEGHD